MESTLSCSFTNARSSIDRRRLGHASILHFQECGPFVSSVCRSLELRLGQAGYLEVLLVRLEFVLLVFVMALYLDCLRYFACLGCLGECDSWISGLWLNICLINLEYQSLYLLLLLPDPDAFYWFGDSGRFPELEGLTGLALSGPSKELDPVPPFWIGFELPGLWGILLCTIDPGVWLALNEALCIGSAVYPWFLSIVSMAAPVARIGPPDLKL